MKLKFFFILRANWPHFWQITNFMNKISEYLKLICCKLLLAVAYQILLKETWIINCWIVHFQLITYKKNAPWNSFRDVVRKNWFLGQVQFVFVIYILVISTNFSVSSKIDLQQIREILFSNKTKPAITYKIVWLCP